MNNYNVHGNIASDDNWDRGDYLAYYLNSRYYGVTINNSDVSSVTKQLNDYKIDYYLASNNYTSTIPGFEEITEGRIPNLKIYHRISDQ